MSPRVIFKFWSLRTKIYPNNHFHEKVFSQSGVSVFDNRGSAREPDPLFLSFVSLSKSDRKYFVLRKRKAVRVAPIRCLGEQKVAKEKREETHSNSILFFDRRECRIARDPENCPRTSCWR